MTVEVVQGFSLLNRWLLYSSVMLAPAQFLGGWESKGLTSLGFLAFNWYNQVIWYNAVNSGELHALSLLPIHFNIVYALSYLGGVAAGNIVSGILLGLGTAGVMILNTITAWKAWALHLPEGYGEYEFFFFGWRTLNSDWRKFFLVWQIGDSVFALSGVCMTIAIPIIMAANQEKREKPSSLWKGLATITNLKYPLIPVGAAAMMMIAWPLVLWVELIVQRNHIDSPTDWVSVWLFVAQIGLLMLPSFGGYFSISKLRSSSS